jgi:NAD(P)-dependent dehydrogenase (short-subunit alcohol dehydrogenase family)
MSPGPSSTPSRTLLVTGAGRGLGKELARQYQADGWKVIATTRQDFDVTDFGKIRTFAEGLRGAPIDVLICNAGISGRRGMTIGSFDYASWEEVLRVNVLGAAAVAEAFADNVAASGRKVIAFLSSRLGSIAETTGYTLAYSSSKAALNMVAKGFSVLLRARGIIVVSLHPGWVRTDMGGAGAPLTAEESVRGLREVIAGLKAEHSGRFFDHGGAELPW